MLTKSTLLKYYKRKEIQEALVAHGGNKEVSVRYGENFGKRPDILTYPRDVLEFALREVTSFHCSEELWENPLALSSTLKKEELRELRTGWDLVLDIDCKILDYSKICADLIVRFLQYCGVKDISVKFSGNKGFHIAVPFEAFPKQVGNILTKDLFPEAARKIAFYIKENIKEELGKQILILEKQDFSPIREKTGLEQAEIIRYDHNEFGDQILKLNVDKFLEIDTILISSRHLYRMPYSLHEKSGLVSLPLEPNKILSFEKSLALPEKIFLPLMPFLERKVSGETARRLLMQALDFEIKIEKEHTAHDKKDEEFKVTSPIKEELFPPCIKLILNGLEDGKKRGLFALINFLGKIGWNEKEIDTFVHQWNKEKNKDQLRENYILGQLQHFKAGERLPPNCDNEAYYKTIGVCKPDLFCTRIKNPANYTVLKWKRQLQEKEETKEKKTKKNKEKVENQENSGEEEQDGPQTKRK